VNISVSSEELAREFATVDCMVTILFADKPGTTVMRTPVSCYQGAYTLHGYARLQVPLFSIPRYLPES
jgi:hypothetical protein